MTDGQKSELGEASAYLFDLAQNKNAPGVGAPRAFQEQLVHEEQYSPKTTVLYHLRAGLSKCTHMEVYFMASFKEKLDKNGNRIYEVQVSNGRGRRVWRTFRPEPTWSKRTIQRELQKFAAELEQQLAGGEVLTREETAQKAAAEAVEAAKNQNLPAIC